MTEVQKLYFISLYIWSIFKVKVLKAKLNATAVTISDLMKRFQDQMKIV
ncbi:hypothetical protein Avbf_00485 [Armadillidium vulgare]|nr:hypothetical protein Avbf_00485 [Armadillidium vulgare]